MPFDVSNDNLWRQKRIYLCGKYIKLRKNKPTEAKYDHVVWRRMASLNDDTHTKAYYFIFIVFGFAH